ncbi:MAG: DUF2017 family protein [Acidimicrobiales bacterium]
MARWQFRPPVERTRHGYRLNIADRERDVVRRLLAEMRDLLTGPSDHVALTRIFPAAYHQAEHAEYDAEYQRLMREELVASRLAGIETVMGALDAKPPLTEAQMMAFLQAVNGLRLVLGTVLDVSEDDDPDDVDPDHPLAAEQQLYGFLSWLLEWTVRALASTLQD